MIQRDDRGEERLCSRRRQGSGSHPGRDRLPPNAGGGGNRTRVSQTVEYNLQTSCTILPFKPGAGAAAAGLSSPEISMPGRGASARARHNAPLGVGRLVWVWLRGVLSLAIRAMSKCKVVAPISRRVNQHGRARQRGGAGTARRGALSRRAIHLVRVPLASADLVGRCAAGLEPVGGPARRRADQVGRRLLDEIIATPASRRIALQARRR